MRRVATLGLAAIALLTAPASLAAACPKTSLGDVEDEVMCPVCKTPLAVAEEAPQAQRERAFIQRLVSRCHSKDEVKRALVAQYGERVLALPGDEGDTGLGDVLAYLIPALVVLLGAVGIGFATLRWRRRRRGAADAAAAAEAPRSRRLESDMERYEL
jgi:cytochrome c-type biogenesis protein CcmH